MNNLVSASSATREQRVESPFLNEAPFDLREPKIAAASFAGLASPFQNESPFPTAFGEGGTAVLSPADGLLMELAAEFEDPEFRDSLRHFAQEVVGLYGAEGDSYTDNELHDSGDQSALNSLDPQIRSAESTLDRIASEFGDKTLLETEVDEVDRVFARHTETIPDGQFDYFIKGIVKKARKVVRGAVKTAKKAAKKGLKVIGKILPIKKLLAALKGLVRPLIERVLAIAINRLPVAVRPAAEQLARKFRLASAEFEDEEPVGASELEAEFDTYLAARMLTTADGEHEAPRDGFFGVRALRPSGIAKLRAARARAVRRIAALRDGESIEPHIEEFVPPTLALTAARTAIGIIGRPRVVSTLAKLVAKLIGKYVGPDVAKPLSNAIVDRGMALLSLEVPVDARQDAYAELVAQTAQDTVQRFAELVDENALASEDVENPAVVEALVFESFESALASNLPQHGLRPELRETADGSGQWVLLPPSGPKFYKKYTEVREVTIDPKTAESIRSFGGESLAQFLFTRRGLPSSAPVRARVHMYEAIPGTWLSHISRAEGGTPGLGSTAEHAWSQIHPLTKAAAGALLSASGLGRDPGEKWLQSRHHIAAGQRFYYLEIIGAEAAAVPTAVLDNRATQFNVVVDGVRGAVRIHFYLNEPVAQQFAAALRKNEAKPIVLRLLLNIIAGAATSFAQGPQAHVRVIQPEEQFVPVVAAAKAAVSTAVRRHLLTRIIPLVRQWVVRVVVRWLESQWDEARAALTRAADAPDNGFTMTLSADHPQSVEVLLKLMDGRLPGLPEALQLPSFSVAVRPGFHRD